MPLRETLELDLSRAIASVEAIDAQLSSAARGFGTQLNASLAGAAGATGGLGGLKTELGAAERAQRAAAVAAAEHAAALKSLGTKAGIVGGAIAVGLGLAVKAAADFDHELSIVGAVSGATGEKLDQLRTAAIAAGQATIFSAKQAAEAEAELAKAGVSAADILGGALVGSLNLAAAGSLDLEQAAVIAAQAMTIFGLSGRDVSHVADVLAAGANKGVSSVQSLGEALSGVGPLAKQMGLSLEETVGTLTLFEQNSIRGSEAGTNLRRLLLSLVNPSQQAADAMAQYGIDVFDASGKFIGLEGAAGSLQKGLATLTDEQRQAALATIFGSFAIQGANVLYSAGEKGVRKWTKAVDDQGAAQRFASATMNNLSGDLEVLRGSLETTFIQTGSKANASLRFLTQGVTGLVNGFADAPGVIQTAGSGLLTLGAATLLAFSGYSRLEPAIRATRTQLTAMGPAAQTAARGLGAVAGITTGLVLGASSLNAVGTSAAGTTTGLLGLAASGALVGASIAGPYGAAVGAGIGVTVGMTKALDGWLGKNHEIIISLDELAGASDRAIRRTFAAAIDETTAGLAKFGQGFDRSKFASESFDYALQTNLGTAQRVGDQFVAMGLLTEEQVTKKLTRAAKAVQQTNTDMAVSQKVVADLGGGMDSLGGSTDDAAQAFDDYTKALAAGTPTISGLFDKAASAVDEWQNANSPEKLLFNLQLQQAAVANFTANVQTLMDAGLTNLAALVAEKGPLAGGELAQALADAEPGVRTALETTLGGANDELATWNAYLNGTVAPQTKGSAVAVGFGVGTGVADGVAGGTPHVTTAADRLKAALTAPLATAAADAVFAGAAAGEGLASGIEAKEARVRAAAAFIASAAGAELFNALRISSPSRVAMAIGGQFGEGFAVGIEGQAGRAQRASFGLASAATSGLRPTVGGLAGGGAQFGDIKVQVVGVPDPNTARAAGRAAGEGLAESLGGSGIARRKIVTSVRATI